MTQRSAEAKIMIRIITPLGLLAATLALAVPAQAQNGTLTRSFVSSSGVDTNPCTITQPCATFAQAYTAIGANGIVAALDPGKYGPLTISTGVTVNGNGWSAITAPANGSGITIEAGSGNVTLIGLEIDGAGVAYDGIFDNSAGSLTVTDCTLQNFHWSGASTTGIGILMQPTSGTLDFTITNTNASNNGYVGILYAPPSGSPNANGVIDHVVANANQTGIYINTHSTTGGTTVATLSNSIVSANNVTGIWVVNSSSSTLKASIDNLNASGNEAGIIANGTAGVLLGGSVIFGNVTYGVENGTSPNTFYTYDTNRINLNRFGDLTNMLSTSVSQQ
jgi:hypothetical protein